MEKLFFFSMSNSACTGRDAPKRTLWTACIAHALHDGYTDLTYVMLPVWQADFGLSYGTEHAFALFYTGTIGSGAVAPIIYGMLGDKLGIDWATIATAMTALAVFPLAFALAPHWRRTGDTR